MGGIDKQDKEGNEVALVGKGRFKKFFCWHLEV
jgi:hypothetical protein